MFCIKGTCFARRLRNTSQAKQPEALTQRWVSVSEDIPDSVGRFIMHVIY